MTSLPDRPAGAKKLGLVIDLDTCVGCQACATNCKEWNASGHSAPLPDFHPYSAGAEGVWFNRVHSYEAGEGENGRTVHFPRSCLHCENAACVTVCPTGASYKRAGAWGLTDDSPESTKGFLLNHVISEWLPAQEGFRHANSDPVTGQAAWYDLRVRIERAALEEAGVVSPHPDPLREPPTLGQRPDVLRYNANAQAGGEAHP